MMRKVMENIHQDEWERMLSYFQKESLRGILEKYEREYPSKFLLQMAIVEPRLFLCGFRAMLLFLKTYAERASDSHERKASVF